MTKQKALMQCATAALTALGLAVPAAAASEAHFVFQNAAAKPATDPNVTVVTGLASFERAKGYGFEPAGAVVDSGANCTRPASPTVDPIVEADKAARFSVVLPEGSYRVTLRFRKAPTGAVAAEARRFSVLPGAPGQKPQREISFLVDHRIATLPALPLNAPGATAVRLNLRECGSYNWDDKLTFAFFGDEKQLLRLDVTPVEVPRLFLMGDSTVTDQPQPPYAGWGQMLPLFFGPNIVVANHAESGETLKSFLSELRLDKVLSQAKAGDWAMLQFSHNDEKEQWSQTHEPAATTFPLYLKLYIAELRRKGVQPVLVTPMQRLRFDAAGKIIETHGAYPAAIRAVAASEDVPLLDLTALSTTLFEAMGPNGARNAFAGHGADGTHQSAYGAFELARCLIAAMRAQNLPLTQYLKTDVPGFDPSTPDDVAAITP